MNNFSFRNLPTSNFNSYKNYLRYHKPMYYESNNFQYQPDNVVTDYGEKLDNLDNKEYKSIDEEGEGEIENEKKEKRNIKNNSFFSLNNIFENNFKDPIIEFFGLKLYLDDIIILSLLFFLYHEGVKDDLLFLALILLLLN